LEDTQDEEPSSKTPKPRGRPPKKQKTGDTPTVPKRRGRGPTKGKAVAAEAIEVSDTPESTPQTVNTLEPSTTFGAPKLRGTAPKQVAQTPQTAQPTLEATQQTLLDFFQTLTPDVAATHSPTPTRGSRKVKKIAKGRATPTPKATRPTRKRKAASPAPVSQTPGKRGKRSTPAEVDTAMVLPTPEDVPEATQDLPSVLETQETPSQPTAIEVAEIQGPGELSPLDLLTNEQTGGSHPAKEVERPPPETSVAAADDSELAGQNTPFKVDGLSIEAEKLDADNDSYGSIGGMLALGRQQVVLDLVAEHQGVFPGGNELRHAFDKRYKKKNPKAGVADRRLIRGVVQSLQYKGKINQYSFSLQTPRGVAIKKLLVDAKLPLDSPLVIETIRQIKAANGNLWFPPGTDLPPDIQQRMLNPVTTWVQAQPSVVETEFDRMYSTSVHQLKKQERAAQRAARDIQKAEDKEMRAELKRMKQLGGELSAWNGKFTDAQREEARRRKAELKSKIQQLRNKFQTVPNDEADEETGPQTVWWADFVQRTDGNTFLKDVKEVRQMEILMEGREDELFQPSKQDGLVMINHFGPEVKVGEDFRQAPASLDKRIKPPTRTPRTALQLPQPHATAPKLVVEESDNAASVVPIKRRRRRVQKHPPTKSRRQKAMAALHQTTTLDEAGEEQEGMHVSFNAR